jgi:phosphate transport system ATP-binding protein
VSVNSEKTSETVVDIRLEKLYYGSFLAVRDTNLTFTKHQVTAIIGPSGCGKSTVCGASTG